MLLAKQQAEKETERLKAEAAKRAVVPEPEPEPKLEPAPVPTRKPRQRVPRTVSMVRALARIYRCAPKEVVGGSRKRRHARARWHLWYRIATRTGHSLVRIGQLTGGFDHTSVRYGIMRHCDIHGLPLPPQTGGGKLR